MISLHRIADLYGITVAVEHYDSSATDGGGNPIPGYLPPVSVARCVFDPVSSVEPLYVAGSSGSERVVTQPRLFMPPGSVVSEKDRISLPGDSTPYEVEGEPRRFPAGVEVGLKRVI